MLALCQHRVVGRLRVRYGRLDAGKVTLKAGPWRVEIGFGSRFAPLCGGVDAAPLDHFLRRQANLGQLHPRGCGPRRQPNAGQSGAPLAMLEARLGLYQERAGVQCCGGRLPLAHAKAGNGVHRFELKLL